MTLRVSTYHNQQIPWMLDTRFNKSWRFWYLRGRVRRESEKLEKRERESGESVYYHSWNETLCQTSNTKDLTYYLIVYHCVAYFSVIRPRPKVKAAVVVMFLTCLFSCGLHYLVVTPSGPTVELKWRVWAYFENQHSQFWLLLKLEPLTLALVRSTQLPLHAWI